MALCTELLGGCFEESGVLAAMREMTIGTPALRYGLVNMTGLELLPNPFVAGHTERGRSIPEESRKTRHMGVVTGDAFTVGDGCVRAPGSRRHPEVVTFQAGLCRVHWMAWGRLGEARDDEHRSATHSESDEGDSSACSPHGELPSSRSTAVWQALQSPSANGLWTSGSSMPAICDA